VPRGYPPHERTLKEGIVVMRRSDGGFDDEFERAIGVDSTFAAVAVGPANSHVLAFTVSGEIHEREILYSLTAVRHVINLKLEERKLSAVIQEARIIQEYLLPASNPSIQGYEVAGRSRPAEVVGGDVYDFFPLRRGGLGLAIADVSGHGLPAALLARDIVTGLRLTAEDGLPVARTVERLNRLIHRSSFSSRFVSLFLVHGTPRGRLTYCNAGHNPPLATRAGALRRLEEGGLVLGPDPTQPYAQGRVRLLPQDKLLLYTDGLVEQRNPLGEEFGLRRLENVLREGIALSAREMVDAVFAEVDRFANRTEVGDDQTVVVLRKSAD